jgi:hypothetical protein
MVVVGLVLGLAGIWSVRAALVAAGAAAAWMLADVLGAGTAAGVAVAAGGGVLAFLVGLVAARVLFFAVGMLVGAVVGSRLLAILETGEVSVAVALVFVPAVALLGGLALERWRQRLIGWATAVAGSALVLTGLGRMAPETLGFLDDPSSAGGQALATGLWVALAVVARGVQRRGVRGRGEAAG